MKLSRFLYHHSPHGKNDIRRIIAAGRVTVDGFVETDNQREISDFTQVSLDDAFLRNTSPAYLMLNKPAGYLSATTDPQHPTVMELIDPEDKNNKLHIAGRLDRASTGLLILTNDGKWSRQLTEPASQTGKTYLITTAKPITPDTAKRFRHGIYFAYEDITTLPAVLEIIAEKTARITILEGRYHQIKRMFHAVGNRITSLHRENIGHITLDPALQPGEYRSLTPEERKIHHHPRTQA